VYRLNDIHGLIELLEQSIAREEREAHLLALQANARANAFKMVIWDIKNSDLFIETGDANEYADENAVSDGHVRD
jgi:hypothetical protein